jgi:hypothetical protein
MHTYIKLSLFVLFLAACTPQAVLPDTCDRVISPGDSIQGAIDSASSGDTICVQAGTYDEYIELKKDNLTIMADGQVIMGGFDVEGDGNWVEGFTIDNYDTSTGIKIYTGNNNTIINNEVMHTYQDGMRFGGTGNRFINNNLHDFGTGGNDPHADCFQGWVEAHDILIEGNYCENTRVTGSNQVIMLENQSGVVMDGIVFRDNSFVMHDTDLNSSHPQANHNRKSGQAPITGVSWINNTIVNLPGVGYAAMKFSDIDNVLVQGNQVYGYEIIVWSVNGSNVTQIGNELHPIEDWKGVTPTITLTVTPKPLE